MPDDSLPGGDMSSCMARMQDDRDLSEDEAAALCQSIREEAKAENGNVTNSKRRSRRARTCIPT